MRRTFHLATIAGAEVRIHWSMLIVAAFVLWPAFQRSLVLLLIVAISLVLLFGSILLHELAHVVAARRFGIHTPTVLLWPLGGVALLSRPPDRPWQDVLIAVAGPLVNLLLWVLSIGLAEALRPLFEWSVDAQPELLLPLIYTRLTIESLGYANALLAAINLIPAFPLDGGRILRAVLTSVAARSADRLTLGISLLLLAVLGTYAALQRDLWLGLTVLLLAVAAATLEPRFSAWFGQAVNWLLCRGDYHFQRQEYELALAHYDRQIQRQPRSARLHHNRGATYQYLRRYTQAITDYDAALQLKPHNTKLALDRLMALAELGFYDEALQGANQLVEQTPDHAPCYLYRGFIQNKREAFQAAFADFEQAVALAPGDALAYNNRGSMYLALGQVEAAGSDFERALQLNPRLVQSLVSRAFIRRRSGDLVGAKVDLDAAFGAEPNKPELLFHRAAVHFAGGDTAAAFADAEWSIALRGREALLHDESWLHEYARGDWQWVEAYYRHCIAQNPGDACALAGLGDALRVNGDTPAALELYREAVARSPDDADIALRYARGLLAVGDVGAALEVAQRALTLTDDKRVLGPLCTLITQNEQGVVEPVGNAA